ncbi:MAG: hypothetical protein Q7R69_03065 [bacterium]|nr:hypothetical protein [bacterium]
MKKRKTGVDPSSKEIRLLKGFGLMHGSEDEDLSDQDVIEREMVGCDEDLKQSRPRRKFRPAE